jgi:hypothetical protein
VEAELLFDHAERMLDCGKDVCLGGFDQILKLSITVSGRARRFPSRITTRNSADLPSISGLLAIP